MPQGSSPVFHIQPPQKATHSMPEEERFLPKNVLTRFAASRAEEFLKEPLVEAKDVYSRMIVSERRLGLGKIKAHVVNKPKK